MTHIEINKDRFRFDYLPDYANYLMERQLKEFVTVNIRFCREADLPLLRPLSRFSEDELIVMSMESSRIMLHALAKGTITELITQNIAKWNENSIGSIDREDISAEDITLLYFLRRKIFSFFLDIYTKNVVLQKFIIGEVDVYTTQEELISLNVHMQLQKEKLTKMNERLTHHQELLFEAQSFSGTGSFLVDYLDRKNSFYSPEYRKILDVEESLTYEEFIECVHPDDRIKFRSLREETIRTGGNYEMEYRFIRNGTEKMIWTRGIIVAENGEPLLSRGTIRDVTKL